MLDDLKNLKDYTSEYIDTRISQLKLQAAESVSRLISRLIILSIAVLFGTLILLFLSLSAAFRMSEILGSEFLGFLSIALLHILILLVFLLFRQKLVEKPVIRSVIGMFFSNQGSDEKERK